MPKDKVICGIDVGSSKIATLIANVSDDGRVNLIGVIKETVEASSSASESARVLEKTKVSISEDKYFIDNEGVIFARASSDDLKKLFLVNQNIQIGQKIDREYLIKIEKIEKWFGDNTLEIVDRELNNSSYSIKGNFLTRFDLQRDIEVQLAFTTNLTRV